MNQSLSLRQQYRPGRGAPGQWQSLLLYAWVLLLILSPLLLVGQYSAATPAIERYIDIRAHAIVELFCGVTALLIAMLILVLSRKHQNGALNLFALGFLVMGVLDVVHAVTSPTAYPGLFVASHTLSMLFGGALLCLGAIRYYFAHRLPISPLRQSGEAVFVLAVLLVVALTYHLLLRPGDVDNLYSFAPLARRTHEFAGALYATAAVLAFLQYRATRQRLVLVVAGILMVFGESAYLFRFSHLWDSTWWTWHAVKAGLYLGTLVVIAAGLVVALRAVESARSGQVVANRKLRHAHDALGLVNYELHNRNVMINASLDARTFSQTLEVIEASLEKVLGSCRYTLVLRVPGDEIAELQRGLQRQSLRWTVEVTSGEASCVRLAQAVGSVGNELVHTCTPVGEAHTTCMCLVLRAQEQVFGYLRVHVERVDTTGRMPQQLDTMSAEIGAIIHNALVHYRWTEAVAFRTALSRVGAILGSTLDLPHVLEAVCRESAQLLGSEASAILFASEPGEGMQLASCCVLGATVGDANAGQPAWIDSDEGRAFFDRLRERGRPLALVKPAVATEAAEFPLGTPGCVWNALAMFPMLSGGELVAVMVIMRQERVSFSAVTLEQGELLAEQVRVAIVNARAYEAVRRTNEQLRHSEEERVRAERLALMGQMAASVAHEVRNPLSAINNCLAVLRRSVHGQTAAALPAMEIIDDEVQRLERLTRNFISFGRSPHRAPTRVHLDTLATRVCEGIERHIHHEELSVSVTREIGGGADAVMFDVDGFQELLWNLLLNAVQAIDGSGTVRVRLRSRRGTVFLAVTDSGPGVAPADRPRIFDPFFSQRSQGAGLGLAIVRQQVETWGGRLRVFGPPGACFALRFPVSAAADGEMAS